MERLPDELLLTIFACLPPEDIVFNCRLVCKRWHGLCRSNILWKSITVTVPEACSSQELHRIECVFLYAPVLRAVQVNATPKPRTTVAMVRGCRNVSSIFLNLDRDWPILRVLLEHYKDNLDCLQVQCYDELPAALLSTVATMNNLKRLILGDLELSLLHSWEWDPFKKLRKANAPVEHLDISKLNHVVFSHASKPFDDVIKRFQNTLKNLYLPSAPATASLIEAVSLCSKLDRLEISYPSDTSLEHVEAALGQLRALRSLNIWVADDADRHFPEFLKQTKLFLTLRELEVGFSFSDKDDKIADAIATRCQNIEVLSLPGSGRGMNFSASGLQKILKCARSLQQLNLNLQKAFSSALLCVMEQYLPSLTYLDVRDTHLLPHQAVKNLQHALPRLFVRWIGDDFEEHMGFAR